MNIQEQLEFSPDVVENLLPNSIDSYKNKNKDKTDIYESYIQKHHVKYHKRKSLKFPIEWNTANGTFETMQTIDEKFQMPEFIKLTSVQETFHMCKQNIPYDMIIGRGILHKIGLIINFNKTK